MTDYLDYSIDLADPNVAALVDELSLWSSRFGNVLLEQLEIRKGINIMDVGCATGFPLLELAHIYGRSCSLTGIDIWSQGLERARFKIKAYGLQNVKIVECDAAHQPFPDSDFDLIVSNLGINNWADPLGVLKECFRVAKPNAPIHLTTNVVGHFEEFYDVFKEILLDMKMPESLEELKVQRAHRGTRETHCSALEEAGWSIVRFIETSFRMRFADGNAMLNHHLTKLGFLDGWKSVVEPQYQKNVFARIEHRLNEIAEESGELRMTVPVLYVEAKKGNG